MKPLTENEPFRRELFYQEDSVGDIWLTIPICGMYSTRDFQHNNTGTRITEGMSSVDDAYDKVAAGARLIMTVRRPTKRLVRAYSAVASWRQNFTFPEFVTAVTALADANRDMRLKSQSSYLVSETGRVLTPTDFIRVPSFSADLDRFRRRGGTGGAKTHSLRDARPDQPTITVATRSTIRAAYSADVALFDIAAAATAAARVAGVAAFDENGGTTRQRRVSRN